MHERQANAPPTNVVRPLFRYLAGIIAALGVLTLPLAVLLYFQIWEVYQALATLALNVSFCALCGYVAITGRAPRWLS